MQLVPAESHQETLLVTVDEAAQMLNVGRTTIYALIKKKELLPLKICGATRIEVTEVKKCIKRNREAAIASRLHHGVNYER